MDIYGKGGMLCCQDADIVTWMMVNVGAFIAVTTTIMTASLLPNAAVAVRYGVVNN